MQHLPGRTRGTRLEQDERPARLQVHGAFTYMPVLVAPDFGAFDKYIIYYTIYMHTFQIARSFLALFFVLSLSLLFLLCTTIVASFSPALLFVCTCQSGKVQISHIARFARDALYHHSNAKYWLARLVNTLMQSRHRMMYPHPRKAQSVPMSTSINHALNRIHASHFNRYHIYKYTYIYQRKEISSEIK